MCRRGMNVTRCHLSGCPSHDVHQFNFTDTTVRETAGKRMAQVVKPKPSYWLPFPLTPIVKKAVSTPKVLHLVNTRPDSSSYLAKTFHPHSSVCVFKGTE